MVLGYRRELLAITLVLMSTIGSVVAGEWSGYIAGELRYFFQAPVQPVQHDENLSLSFQPEYYHAWDNENQSLTFVPFLRWDGHDNERTHFDIRELTWIKASSAWELRVGVRKLFWGVTESQHLVDIINQTDLVENPDGEDKLGQPMLNMALIQEWGTLDLFLMPWFRERTFPGIEGRLRPTLLIDTDQASYASGAKQHHLDFAIRWSHTIGVWDIGLSYFDGTGRDPRLMPALNNRGQPILIPHYEQITQAGLDLQATLNEWLLKLELISRDRPGGRFTALTGGFEYTFVGIAESNTDLGLLAEYSYDDRDEAANLDNDIFFGMRLTLNDAQSSELLAGVISDLNGGGRLYSLEASRRLGSDWKLSIEARLFSGLPESDPLFSLRQDDYLQIELFRFF